MRLPRKIILISLVIDLIVVGIFVIFFLRGNGTPTASGETTGGGQWVVFIVPGIILITGLSLLPLFRSLFAGTIKNGVTADATVLKVWDTGVSINTNVQVGMLLEVHPRMASTFQAEAKKLLPRINPNAIREGMTVQVIYDPNNPKRIEVTSIPEEPISQDYTQSSTTEARLRELSNLREKDLISKDEYDKKRDEILKNL